MEYDSSADTLRHIKRVSALLSFAAEELLKRGAAHDSSKLESPEKECFDIITPLLKTTSYGSDEYKATMSEHREDIKHHQKSNTHHPEYYENGINGFDLFDLVEMFFDWKAASERHSDGDIRKSIEINKDRFDMGEVLGNILMNTADRYCKDAK